MRKEMAWREAHPGEYVRPFDRCSLIRDWYSFTEHNNTDPERGQLHLLSTSRSIPELALEQAVHFGCVCCLHQTIGALPIVGNYNVVKLAKLGTGGIKKNPLTAVFFDSGNPHVTSSVQRCSHVSREALHACSPDVFRATLVSCKVSLFVETPLNSAPLGHDTRADPLLQLLFEAIVRQ